MVEYKKEFIQFLENAGVLKFGDFTAKSGRKIPYFINAGDIKTGEQIKKLGEFYAKAYLDKLGKKKAVLYGPAYKGIPIAVSVSVALANHGMDLPFFFNRKEEKDHGEGGRRKGDPSLPHDSIRDRKEGGQADACDQQVIETGAGKPAIRKQAFLRISRGLFHQAVRVIVVSPQRQGREGVGDQVDPQDMAGF